MTYGINPRIVFLLRKDSIEARAVLAKWAQEHGVAIDIDIVRSARAPEGVTT